MIWPPSSLPRQSSGQGSKGVEPMAGIEPATDGLRNRCSTAELHWHPLSIKSHVANELAPDANARTICSTHNAAQGSVSSLRGRVAEWLKAPDSKSGVGATLP